MDGQGTEDHVKALRREWGLRHIPPDIGHLRSRGLFPGHGQHFLRQVHAGDRRRAVFRRIDAVPAVAAAQIQHPLPGEVRQQKEFIANVANAENMPEKTQKNVEFFGTCMVNDKHVISLQNDRGSSYQAYISVQNELVAAYNELRDELAKEKFGVTYSELNDLQQKAVREIYPQRISEAEPKKYGEKKK